MQYLNNKYSKLYFKIVQTKSNDTYTEKHHIIPRSLNGSDEQSNIAIISAREHFICHYLLTKMFKKKSPEYFKMIKAFMIMKSESKNQTRYLNSRLFESLRKEFSLAQSFAQSGSKNSQSGTVWIHNLNLQESKKIQIEDLDTWLDNDWIKGRKIKFVEKIKKQPKKEINQKLIEQEAVDSFYKFKHGNYASVRDFCRRDHNKSHVYTLRIWKKYIIGLETVQGQKLIK